MAPAPTDTAGSELLLQTRAGWERPASQPPGAASYSWTEGGFLSGWGRSAATPGPARLSLCVSGGAELRAVTGLLQVAERTDTGLSLGFVLVLAFPRCLHT